MFLLKALLESFIDQLVLRHFECQPEQEKHVANEIVPDETAVWSVIICLLYSTQKNGQDVAIQ